MTRVYILNTDNRSRIPTMMHKLVHHHTAHKLFLMHDTEVSESNSKLCLTIITEDLISVVRVSISCPSRVQITAVVATFMSAERVSILSVLNSDDDSRLP